MQVIDNLLPREEPIGHFLGQPILRLARLGVPVKVLAQGFLVDEKSVREHLYRALTNDFLAIAPNEDWPKPLNKIQRKNVVPRRKPPLRSNAKSGRRKNRA